MISVTMYMQQNHAFQTDALFTADGQCYGKCHGCEIVN